MPQRYTNYQYSTYQRPTNYNFTNSPKRSFKGKFIMALVLILVLSGGYLLHSKHTQAKELAHQEAVAEAAQRALGRQNFAAKVQQVINQNPDIQFSVAATDLSDDSSIKVGQTDAMDAASCGKVLTASLFLHDVENGSESLSERINGSNAKHELQLLIQESDDNAWVAFNDDLTHPALLNYAQSLGLNNYNPTDNFISTADMSALLQKLYSGQLLNNAHTQELLSYMQNTNYEQFITPAVPGGYRVYHKVGLDGGEINDAAVITNGNQHFVLSIFTNSNSDTDSYSRAQMMQQIVRAAVDNLK